MSSGYRTRYVHLTGSGQVLAGEGWVSSFYVNSTSSGTILLYDYLSATGTVIHNTITPAIGFHNMDNMHCLVGCYANVGGTSLDVTFKIIENAN